MAPINLEEMRLKKVADEYRQEQKKVIDEILNSEDAADQIFTMMMELARYINTLKHMAIITEDQFQKCSYRQYKDGLQSVIGTTFGMPFKQVLAEAKGLVKDDGTGTN